MAIVTKRIGNKTRVYVSATGSSYSWKEVLGVKEIGTPKQNYNVVDLDELNQADGIAEAAYGTRDAGEITLQVNTKTATNDGLAAIMAAHEAEGEIAVKIAYSADDADICARAIVPACALSDASNDTELYYEITLRPQVKVVAETASSSSSSN